MKTPFRTSPTKAAPSGSFDARDPATFRTLRAWTARNSWSLATLSLQERIDTSTPAGRLYVRQHGVKRVVALMGSTLFAAQEALPRQRLKPEDRWSSCSTRTTPGGTVAMTSQFDWHVEWLLKWIKGHLWIRHFYGTLENAVQTKISIAVCVDVLIAIVREEPGVARGLATTLQSLSASVFERVQRHELLAQNDPADSQPEIGNQWVFNGL